MSVTLTPETGSLLAKVIAIVKDDSGKLTNPDDYNAAISSALLKYSKHRPDISVADITGNSTNDYALPDAWVDEFSAIRSIEYPVGNVPADIMDNDGYTIYQTTTAKKIRLLEDSPSAAETFRVAFTILRTEATIPDSDIDAFCFLAAALCLEQLANAFAQSSDSTIAADSVNYRTKSYEFSQRAKALMKLYKEHMGIKEDDITPAASAVADMDLKYPGGGERLTHRRRDRKLR